MSHACRGEPEPEAGVAPRGAAASKGSAAFASAANALALAAAPTFALLGLWTAFDGGRSDTLCMGMRDASPLNGMTLMYALMSAFHATPWLNLISRR